MTDVPCDAQNPAPYEELLEKFRSLAQETLGAEATENVIDAVSRLDALQDARELTKLLTGE